MWKEVLVNRNIFTSSGRTLMLGRLWSLVFVPSMNSPRWGLYNLKAVGGNGLIYLDPASTRANGLIVLSNELLGRCLCEEAVIWGGRVINWGLTPWICGGRWRRFGCPWGMDGYIKLVKPPFPFVTWYPRTLIFPPSSQPWVSPKVMGKKQKRYAISSGS